MINQFTEGFKARPNQTYLTNLPSHLTKQTTNHYNLQDLLFLPFRPPWHTMFLPRCGAGLHWMLEMVSVSMLARLKMLNHAFVFVEAAEIIQISDSIAWVRCASGYIGCMYIIQNKYWNDTIDHLKADWTKQTDSLPHLRRTLQKMTCNS